MELLAGRFCGDMEHIQSPGGYSGKGSIKCLADSTVTIYDAYRSVLVSDQDKVYKVSGRRAVNIF